MPKAKTAKVVKTQEQKFLDWCKEYGMKFKKISTKKAGYIYELNPKHDAYLVVQGVKINLNKVQDSDSISVFFDATGHYCGGTNIIWNTGLPWQGK